MPKTLRLFPVLVATIALLLSSGCAPDAGGGAGSGRLQVVAAFYPLQFLAERVGGDHTEVTSLTEPGVEPHDLELTPRQVGSIGSAGLVVYQSGFQASVDEAVAQSGNEQTLDMTTVVPPVPVTEHEGHEHGGHEHEEEGHEHEGEGHEEEGHEHEHEHGDIDPHVWLNPTNMITMAEAVFAKLSEIDPDNAAAYEANLAALRTELTGLDTEFSTGLATCERREFITSHAAFGYLASAYDLTQIAISGLSPDAEPSPARIGEVHAAAKEHGITTIFYETLVSPAVAESIAGDLGLKTAVLDPLEGITPDSRGSDYVAVMKSNLAALQAANGCQ
ncbi:metal ABC transporter substrate-binding protein [Propionibacteriaceae bacterium Y2011]